MHPTLFVVSIVIKLEPESVIGTCPWPEHGLSHTGEFTDGFGNLVYVYAVGDPEVASKKNRYDLAHQKGSGFGMVTIDTEAKTYYLEAFKFSVDATDGKASNQFPGWPVTIQQKENAGENVLK